MDLKTLPYGASLEKRLNRSFEKLIKTLPSNLNEQPDDPWLNRLNYSQAFLVCIGAGPWKLSRRKSIQIDALQRLHYQSEDKITPHLDCFTHNWYPLQWQNMLLCKAVAAVLNSHCSNFEQTCKKIVTSTWGDLTEIKNEFYKALQCNERHVKCVSLFVRDKLKLPAFPLDRHVKNYIRKYNIPPREDLIIELCENNGINPSKLNRYIFGEKSSNFDFSNHANYFKALTIIKKKYYTFNKQIAIK